MDVAGFVKAMLLLNRAVSATALGQLPTGPGGWAKVQKQVKLLHGDRMASSLEGAALRSARESHRALGDRPGHCHHSVTGKSIHE